MYTIFCKKKVVLKTTTKMKVMNKMVAFIFSITFFCIFKRIEAEILFSVFKKNLFGTQKYKLWCLWIKS